MVTKSSVAPEQEPKNYLNCFLWGCLAAVILFFISLCCLGTLIFVPLFTDFDPLGLDLRHRIEQYLPLEDFLDDPSVIPGLPDGLDEAIDSLTEVTPDEITPSDPGTGASNVDLSTYVAQDFQATFDYPTGWDAEPEDYGVTFYDTDSYTYLYVGEVLFDTGTTARQIADDVMDSLRAESEEGSFVVYENTPFTVPTGDDAYLVAFEFIDTEGYYQWVLDLETISGESNVYFFLSGEDPEDYPFFRELIEIIAATFSR